MNIINKIIQTQVIEVISGGSNGSIIVLKLKNSVEDEFSFFIYCTWRLETDTLILTGSKEPGNGKLFTETQLLLNDKIKDIKKNKFNDIVIIFESKKTLNVFCDITAGNNLDYDSENWSICDIKNNKCYSANKQSEIETSAYE